MINKISVKSLMLVRGQSQISSFEDILSTKKCPKIPSNFAMPFLTEAVQR